MTQWTDRYPLVIPAANRDDATKVAYIIDPDSGGVETFSVPLNASGKSTDVTTHWAASTVLPVDVRDAFVGLTDVDFQAFVDQRAEELGRDLPGDVTDFRAAVAFGPEGGDFFEFIDSLGLQRVQSEEPI